MIFDLLGYISWQNKNSQPDKTLNLCLYGQDNVNSALSLLNGRKTPIGAKLNVRHVWAHDLQSDLCHVLVVAQQLSALPEILQPMNSRQDIFIFANHNSADAPRGSMTGFSLSDKRLTIWANVNAINASRVRLSSQILKIATLN
jgi:hypothetical protein